MFVAGSAIFNQPDYRQAIDAMRAELVLVGRLPAQMHTSNDIQEIGMDVQSPFFSTQRADNWTWQYLRCC